jgi:prepilin-type N-terminal cleavage/methylation domain-containing protein
MLPQIKRQQGGFTLVEIAIVLVIIGLLLGGILKGQELITSARVRNIADQSSGVQAAYYGFIDRYRAVPGDMAQAPACAAIGAQAFGAAACPAGPNTGNGNGRLEQDQPGEASGAWSHLSGAGFITGAYPGGANSVATYVPAAMSPQNAFNGAIMLTYSARYQSVAAATPRLVMFTGRNIPVNVMRELDVKMDDGVPSTGVMRATTNQAAPDPSGSLAACVAGAGAAMTWNVTGNSADCGGAYLY